MPSEVGPSRSEVRLPDCAPLIPLFPPVVTASAKLLSTRLGYALLARSLIAVLACFFLAGFFLASSAQAADLAGADASSAPSQLECATAHRDAQIERNQGNLLASRTELARCLHLECNPLIRKACGDLLSEVELALPSIVLAATVQGEDLLQVTVNDGTRFLTERLDGVPLHVNPGPLRLTFRSKGMLDQTLTLVVRTGEQNRIVSVEMERDPSLSPGVSSTGSARRSGTGAPDKPRSNLAARVQSANSSTVETTSQEKTGLRDLAEQSGTAARPDGAVRADGAVRPDAAEPSGPAEPSSPEKPHKSWVAYALLGSGVTLGASGAALSVSALVDYKAAKHECAPRCSESTTDGIMTRAWVGNAMLGASLVAVVLGIHQLATGAKKKPFGRVESTLPKSARSPELLIGFSYTALRGTF